MNRTECAERKLARLCWKEIARTQGAHTLEQVHLSIAIAHNLQSTVPAARIAAHFARHAYARKPYAHSVQNCGRLIP
jgi:hypothetical protein